MAKRLGRSVSAREAERRSKVVGDAVAAAEWLGYRVGWNDFVGQNPYVAWRVRPLLVMGSSALRDAWGDGFDRGVKERMGG